MKEILLSKIKLKHFFGFLSLAAASIWLAVFSLPSPELKLVFCDVGQGDAILIQKGFDQILIDGGPNKKVLDCLANNLPFWDRQIEMVILTHPQSDHLGGLGSVFERYKVKYFLAGPEGNISADYLSLMGIIKSKGSLLTVMNPYLGEKVDIGGIELVSLWPSRKWLAEKIPELNSQNQDLARFGSGAVLGAATSQDLNDFSLVFLFEYGDFKALLPGDADAGIQEEILLNNPTLGQVNLLKVPHHGAKTSLRDDFLEVIKPKEAIISVGKNSYGHPNGDLIKKLENLGTKVRRTDLEGEIKIEI